MSTYYEVFGLPSSATQDELRKRYRELAKLFHPDRNRGNPMATKKFSELTEANEVLSDPARRAAYDQKLVSEASARAADPDIQKGVSIGGETGEFLGRQLVRTGIGQRIEAGAKVMGARDLPSALSETGRRLGLGIAELLKNRNKGGGGTP